MSRVDAVHKRQSDQNKRIKTQIASDRSSKFTSSSKQDRKGKPEIRNLIACRSCGRNHEVRKCPAYGKECYKCQKRNHFAKMCRAETKQTRIPNKGVKEIRAESSDDFVIETVEILESQTVMTQKPLPLSIYSMKKFA